MKNINIKSFMLLAGVLGMTACSENAWNDKLDGFKEPGVYDKTETVEYTLTAADYKSIASNSTNKSIAEAAGESSVLAAIGTNGYFPSSEAARKYIPAFVANSNFPYFTLNNGSTVRMTYNLEVGQNEEVVAINSGVKTYTVTEADYQAAWGSDENFINGFSPVTPASASIPALLKANITDAAAGDYAVVSYAESATNPVFGGEPVKEPQVYIEESFSESQGDFTIENVVAPEDKFIWSWGGANYGMKATAYVSGTNYPSEAWLISPEVELADDANAVLTFDQATNYFTNVEAAAEEATVSVREVGGNWVRLEIPTRPTSMSWTFVASGDIDLSAYNGKKIQIGFCYKSDAKAGTWEIKNVKLMDGGATRSANTRSADSSVVLENKNAIYRYDGSAWKVPGSMIVLQPADYTAMGQTYGNLSGTLPDQLLPIYLSKTLPYAAEEAAEIVVYKYYDSSSKVTSFQARQYTLTDGEWVFDSGVEPLTEKFSRKDNEWTFNPSVEMVLPYARNTDPTYTYFMAVKDWVFDNVTKKMYPDAEPANGTTGPAFIDYRNNAEFWSGASAYYGNVDVRASTAKSNAPEGYTAYDGLSDEQISELILKRFATESFLGALSIVDADVQMVDGMDVTYTFIFTAYTSTGTQEYKVEYLLVDKGKFEFRHLWKSEDNSYVEVEFAE